MPDSDDDQIICRRVQEILGREPKQLRVIDRGYTKARRLLVDFQQGASVFAKVATDNLTATWLRDEYRVYKHVNADFMPTLLGWSDDGEKPIMLLEDLSGNLWPEKWTDKTIALVLQMLDSVRSTPAPSGLPMLASMREDLASWSHVEREPELFLDLGLCSQTWLAKALPKFLRADEDAPLAGTELVHLDVRSDNICFAPERAILVDWNWACIGNAAFDLILWLPSLHMEGGPLPKTMGRTDAQLIALSTGYFAHRATLPPPHPGSKVRDLQYSTLKVALPWCAEALGLPRPDGPLFAD